MYNENILKGKVKNLEYIILSIVLLLALIARIYKINSPIADWHSWRQADTASVTRTYVARGINLLYPRYHDISSTQTGFFNPQGYRFVEFPIYNAVQAFLTVKFPFFSLEVWGRLISIFSSLTSTYLLFLLGRRFLGRAGGILTAFYYAILPFNIYFTRVILPEPMAVAFALAAIWFFAKFIDEEGSCSLFTSAAFFALALLVKPFTIFYAAPIFFLAVRKYGFKEVFRQRKFWVAGVIALYPVILWRAWMSRFPEGIPFWKWAFNSEHIRFRPAFWRWIFGERLGRLILGIWGLIPFSFGLLITKGKGFIHWFALGCFLYVAVIAGANVRHDYYQTIIIPAVALILAQGTIIMWEARGVSKIASRGLLLFSLFLGLGIGTYQVKDFYNINHPEIIEAGNAIDRIAPKDALVIAPYNGDTAFLYQTKRWGWPFIDRPLNELIDKGASYLVSVNMDDKRIQEIENEFKVIEKTNSYVIVNLKNPNNR